MIKKDFKKELKEFYAPSTKEIGFVDVPRFDFVMIDGQGNPNNSPEFSAAIEALFSFSYTLKFKLKKGQAAVDYGVMPLEGLWWADDMMAFDPIKGDKSAWKWTAMIMQPYITDDIFTETVAELAKKKDLPALPKLRLESFTEGPSVQLMHIGPFAEEGPNIIRLHQAIEEEGFMRSGKHHEIYLSDLRRVAPEKLKTVIRQPYKK